MATRLGLGPVFYYEWLLSSRRWQTYAGRALFLLIILAALFFAWLTYELDRPYQAHTIQEQARMGTTIFATIIGTQLALVLLAAPAVTAGSVCLDKARGILAHLLVTELSSSEIVLGKMGARLLPVLGLLLCTLPVLALNILLGGLDPEALAGATLVTAGVAVLGCAMALLLSVWGSKTHEVLLATYVLWAALLLVYPAWGFIAWEFTLPGPPAGLLKANPFWLAFAPYTDPGTVGVLDCALFLAGCLGLSALLAALAVLSLRAAAERHSARPARARRRLTEGLSLHRGFWGLLGPSLDFNPVLWREWHRRRPSRWITLIWGLYVAGAVFFTGLTVFDTWSGSSKGMSPDLAAFVNAFMVSLGLLLVSVGSSSSLAEERVRGSLDVLLTTPLPTRAIVWGKWWGAFRILPLLAILPGLLCLALALHEGRALELFILVPLILAYGAALTSLGLALATWVPRLGRAVAYSVIGYVLVTVAWPFAVVALFSHDDVFGPGLASGSPFFGAAFLTIRLQRRFGRDMEVIAPWGVFWTVAYLVIAAALYVATLLTFDRCLGRVSADAPVPGPVSRRLTPLRARTPV
jgi:ABC-type transport system involved in multi-copper enzyme maturation permease subunit